MYDEHLLKVLTNIHGDPGALAQLRRGLGKSIGEAPDTWQYVIPLGYGKQYREDAAFATLTLFAAHQQGQGTFVHAPSQPLGMACRHLLGVPGASVSIERRFVSAIEADEVGELANRLRGLVTMLRSHRIQLDYLQLFNDLSTWNVHDRRIRTRRHWARQFYSLPATTEPKEQA